MEKLTETDQTWFNPSQAKSFTKPQTTHRPLPPTEGAWHECLLRAGCPWPMLAANLVTYRRHGSKHDPGGSHSMFFHAASPCGSARTGHSSTSTQHWRDQQEKETPGQGEWEKKGQSQPGCILTARPAFGWSTLIWVCLHIRSLHCLTFLPLWSPSPTLCYYPHSCNDFSAPSHWTCTPRQQFQPHTGAAKSFLHIPSHYRHSPVFCLPSTANKNNLQTQ